MLFLSAEAHGAVNWRHSLIGNSGGSVFESGLIPSGHRLLLRNWSVMLDEGQAGVDCAVTNLLAACMFATISMGNMAGYSAGSRIRKDPHLAYVASSSK